MTSGILSRPGRAPSITRPDRTTATRSKLWGRVGTTVAVVFLGLLFLYLYAPLLVTMLFSFASNKVQTLPIEGFTWSWYGALFADAQMLDAIRYSLLVAVVSVSISAVAGLGFALLAQRVKVRGGGVISALSAAPMVAPGMVLGISLLVVFNLIGVQPGFLTIAVGHAAFVTPLVSFVIQQRLKVADLSLEDASRDLGAGPLRTFWHVTLPGVRVALLAACLLGFTLSMDEIAVTYFLAGTQPTLPVYVWGLVRFGFTPEVNAAFTLIGGGSLLLLALAGVLMLVSARRARRQQATGAPSDRTAEQL
ncbi:ABC transporter permease [Sphaerisporangium sp. NPDC051017]|uniref:ABC transporter permease n=1 Tax=Sphaerisporangium sp. NPDC051017 TaxID=3154636 RepID=UPI0034272205